MTKKFEASVTSEARCERHKIQHRLRLPPSPQLPSSTHHAMIAVDTLPPPAGAPGDASYFACFRLRATMSTRACADQWRSASSMSTCRHCTIEHQHDQQHQAVLGAAPPVEKRPVPQTECLRCGRTDPRIVKALALCVLCFNRQREARVGRNAKGQAPQKFQPLVVSGVATGTADGIVTHHAIAARHALEAVGVVARNWLPVGTRLSPARPGETRWIAQHGRLVLVCSACGHAGLLERAKGDRLGYHCPACQRRVKGAGWALARPRAPVVLLNVGDATEWIQQADETPPMGEGWRVSLHTPSAVALA